jgi:hypothetical protein
MVLILVILALEWNPFALQLLPTAALMQLQLTTTFYHLSTVRWFIYFYLKIDLIPPQKHSKID